MADRYASFGELSRNEVEGRDYEIVFRNEGAPVLIMAPHGGKIERGTTELAAAIAGDGWGFYSLKGIKEGDNFPVLHVTSTCFDEPEALRLAASSPCTVAVHGCKESGAEVEEIYVGGLNADLRDSIWEALVRKGFCVLNNGRFPGIHPDNICNRNMVGKGMQLEVTVGLRRRMFRHFPDTGETTPVFADFVGGVRDGIHAWLEREQKRDGTESGR
jgi:phage replication-related protein YjqB (UPF0714/DUF867 family)